jgi:serine/threonine-protein kinase
VWGRELAEVDVAAFVIRRLPVTFEEYGAFLHDAGDDTLLPRDDAGAPLTAREPHFPVFGISIAAARAYAVWRAQATGVPWRLPTEIEWEKAARGVDGRAYPWGARFDALRCAMRESQPGTPHVRPVGAVAEDVSPYGVRDVAGGIADWVEPIAGELTLSKGGASKGGAWCDWSIDCHAGARRTYRAHEHAVRVGFRLARSL